MTAPLTQAAEDAARFSHRREAYNRQVENDALDRYDDALTLACGLIVDSLGDDPWQTEDRALAAEIVKRAGLDVCRALGEA